jgi:hypothetical protein
MQDTSSPSATALIGHPEQQYTIFSTYIYGVAVIAVGAIVFTMKKSVK